MMARLIRLAQLHGHIVHLKVFGIYHLLAQLVHKVHKVFLVQLQHKEWWVSRDCKAFKVLVVLRECKDRKVFKVFRVLKVKMEQVVLAALRDFRGFKGCRESKALNLQDSMGKVIRLKTLLLQQRILHILPHQILGQPVQHLLLDKEYD